MKRNCTNLFGDKDKFAIEAELWQHDESYIFINYCLWIKNNMVGDKEQTVVLSAELDRISKIAELKGQRCITPNRLSAKQITDNLINRIWFDNRNNNDIIPTGHTELKNLDILSQYGECFQGFYVFLLEGDGYEWLLSKEDRNNKYLDIKLPHDFIYSYFNEFVLWIKDSTVLVLRTDIVSI